MGTRLGDRDRAKPALERDAGRSSAPARRELAEHGAFDVERPGGCAEDGVRGGSQRALLEADVVAEECLSEGKSRDAE